MSKRLNWIADIDSSKVSVFTVVQAMNSRESGKYLLGKGKSNGRPYVVGIYLYDTLSSEANTTQPYAVGYVDE